MRKLDRARIYRFKGIFRLCMCLVVVGLVTAGSLSCFAGGGPRINSLKVTPATLDAGNSALYWVDFTGAEEAQLIEGGNIISSFKGPSAGTFKGNIEGLPANAIQAGGITAFDTILKVKSKGGEVQEKVTVKLANVPTQMPVSTTAGEKVSENKSIIRMFMRGWGPLTYAPVSSTSPAGQATLPEASVVTPPNDPDFFKCPTSCDHCLTPDEAAGKGLTTKCSEQPCYFSPNLNKKWFCYSEPVGYCCKEGQPGQAGQVGGPITKDQCAQTGGDYWSLDKNEAIQACQPTGWCCRDGQVGGPFTKAECAAVGGSLWSINQAELIQACQPLGYCCSNHNVTGPMTQTQCAYAGGCCWSTNQSQTAQACQPPTYWCCSKCQVYQTTTPGAGCYASREQAAANCRCGDTGGPLLR